MKAGCLQIALRTSRTEKMKVFSAQSRTRAFVASGDEPRSSGIAASFWPNQYTVVPVSRCV